MKLFLLCAITLVSSIDLTHVRKTVKNTFHRIQRPFLRLNVTETVFMHFCLEPIRPTNADSEDSIELFSIKMRYSSDTYDLFCVPLDVSNIP